MPREAPVTIATLPVLSVIFAPYPVDVHSYMDAPRIFVSRFRDDRRPMISRARNHPGRTTL
jgi:hypothetical protein